ncbi:dephospho-CoA kinase [Candidatus Woesearchaeota archaeon]|nr:dephospho-CoA kinase [Candidatus Woesearchaeota archaeon]
MSQIKMTTIIGITGSISSGKTVAAKIFSRHWYNRIDADEIGHQILQKNSDAYRRVIKEFGNEILDKNRNIDRKKLGDVVFNDDKKLKKLNSITHPMILNEIRKQIKKIQKKCGNKTKIIIDAPLLLETKAKDLIDKIIVVKTDKKNIYERAGKKYPREKIEKILKSQMPLEEKLKRADFVIDNNKDLRHLEKQILGIIQNIEKK